MTAQLPRRFFAAATGVGAAFATMGVAVPLELTALGERPALTGTLLAFGTIAVALGALAGGSPALGGPRGLALSLATCTVGTLVLAVPVGVAGIAVSVGLVGAGIGLFWVASQSLLARHAGDPGSESGFVFHYAAYTLGAVLGSSLTGAIVACAEHAGLEAALAVRLGSFAGVAATGYGFVLWLPLARRADAEPRRPAVHFSPGRDLAIQAPDLLLVAALAMLLPLAPLVLADTYALGPLAIGVVMAGVSLAKIGGSFTARALTKTRGPRRTILTLLAGAGVLSLVLSLAPAVSIFVVILFAATLGAAGAWPLVVDSAHARVAPEGRHDLAVVWNAREYATVAGGTLVSGWLFDAFGSPAPLFVLGACLIAGAALSASVVLRRPVWQIV